RFGLEHEWDTDLPWLDGIRWKAAYAPQSYERTGEELSTSAAGDFLLTEDFLAYDEDFIELDVQARSSFDLMGSRHALTYGFDGDYTTTEYERIDRVTDIALGTVTETRAGGFNFANADTIRADVYLQGEMSFFDGRLELIPGLRLVHYTIDPKPDSDYQPVPGAEPRKLSETKLTAQVGALF